MHRFFSYFVLLVPAATLVACTDDPAPPTPRCPPPGAGTHHHAPIVADEIWRAEDSPHVIEAPLAVTGGATLTIESCAVVQIASGAGIEVGLPDGAERGQLVARGTAERPISIGAIDAAPWAALVVHAPSRIELTHTVVEGGGAGAAAMLIGVGGGVTPAADVLLVDTVSVIGSASAGVRLDRAARFAAGSRALTITGAAAEPISVGLHGLVGLPDGTFTGNGTDEIVVEDDGANARPGLQVDTVLRHLGVPYRVGRAPGDDLRVGANGGPATTLTVEAGVVLRFQRDGGVRLVSDVEGWRGRLLVRGTAPAPITFTSLSATDGPGSWSGLYFESPMADHDVAFARIERAGGDCSCSLASCSPLEAYNAAVILDGRPLRAFMRDSTIVDSAGHAFVRSWLDHVDLDFAATNTVQGIAGCTQTMPERSDMVCPDEAFTCTL